MQDLQRLLDVSTMSNGSTVLKNSPSLTNLAMLVLGLFNPDGILLNVVFFVYGQNAGRG